MTLVEILKVFDFELIEDNNELFISDNQDNSFELYVTSVKEAIEVISRHIEVAFEEIIGEYGSDLAIKAKDTSRWEYSDYRDVFKELLENNPHDHKLSTMYQVAEALSDMDNLLIEEN